MSEFGKRVRHYREARGMTQESLAVSVGRGHSMLAAIERGSRKIHADEIATFAQALDVSPLALMGWEGGDLYADGFEAGYAAALNRIDLIIRDGRRYQLRAS